MEYALISTEKEAIRLLRFPTTLSEAVGLVKGHFGFPREGDLVRITRYAVLEEVLPNEAAIEHEIDMGEWQFESVDGELCLLSLEAFPRDTVAVTAEDVFQATLIFLRRVAPRSAESIRLVDADETFSTLFKTSLSGDPVVYAPRQTHAALAGAITGVGLKLRT